MLAITLNLEKKRKGNVKKLFEHQNEYKFKTVITKPYKKKLNDLFINYKKFN